MGIRSPVVGLKTCAFCLKLPQGLYYMSVGLWKIMAKFGCPAKFIAMVQQFHDGMLAQVQNDGKFF